MDDNNPNSLISGGTVAVHKYALSLKGEGIAVEREIDEATALEVLGVVMRSRSTIAYPGGPTVRDKIPHSRPSGQQSLREFLDEVTPKRNPDQILAVAKYIENETSNPFTRNDVKGRFQDAAEPVPGNYSRDFQWAVRNGWIAPSPDDKDHFYVTDAGNKALDEKFSAEVKKRTGVARGRRGGKRSTKRSKKASASE